jgi:hypothetical protein
MRAAEPLEMDLQIGLRERSLVSLWCALSLAAFAAWLASHGWAMVRPDAMPVWVPALAASVSGALAGAGAWFTTARDELATLAWIRGSWTLTGPGSNANATATQGSLALMLDLGPWMLLRFRADDRRGSRWFCVDESAAGSRWHLLRAALYRPVRSGTAPRGPAGDSAP